MEMVTKLQDQEVRAEVLQGRADTGLATFRGFAADTGVNYAMFVTLCLQPGLQQSCPRLVNIYSITGGETVAENQDGWHTCRVGGDSNKAHE